MSDLLVLQVEGLCDPAEKVSRGFVLVRQSLLLRHKEESGQALKDCVWCRQLEEVLVECDGWRQIVRTEDEAEVEVRGKLETLG